MGVPYVGVLIIRMLLFRVPYFRKPPHDTLNDQIRGKIFNPDLIIKGVMWGFPNLLFQGAQTPVETQLASGTLIVV